MKKLLYAVILTNLIFANKIFPAATEPSTTEIETLNQKNPNVQLLLAIDADSAILVEDAIKNGANVDLSVNGITPLMYAIYKNKNNIIKYLLENYPIINVNQKSINDFTPLAQASFNGNKEIVKLLLDKQASVDQPFANGITPLMAATEKEHREIVNLLLQAKANINVKTLDGDNILMFASNPEIVSYLLDNGALIDERNDIGLSALTNAANNNLTAVVDVLLRRGAKIDEKFLEKIQESGKEDVKKVYEQFLEENNKTPTKQKIDEKQEEKKHTSVDWVRLINELEEQIDDTFKKIESIQTISNKKKPQIEEALQTVYQASNLRTKTKEARNAAYKVYESIKMQYKDNKSVRSQLKEARKKYKEAFNSAKKAKQEKRKAIEAYKKAKLEYEQEEAALKKEETIIKELRNELETVKKNAQHALELIESSEQISDSDIPAAPELESSISTSKTTKEKAKESKVPASSKKRFIDLMIINSDAKKHYEPIINTLGIALCQKPGIIIANGHLLYRILYRINSYGTKDEEAQMDKVLKEISWKDFDIYVTDDLSIFLFIPIEYKQKIFAEFKTYEFDTIIAKYLESAKKHGLIKDEESHEKYIDDILLGFKINPLHNKLNKILIKDNGMLAMHKKGIEIEEDIEFYYEFLENIKIKDIKKLEEIFYAGKNGFNAIYNINFEGHGVYSEGRFPIKLTKAKILKETIGKDIEIAGFNLSDFRRFFQFLSNSLLVNFVSIFSCYSADLNWIIPFMPNLIYEKKHGKIFGTSKTKEFKELISPLKNLNFPIITGAFTSSSISQQTKKSLINCNLYKEKISFPGFLNYRKYFELIKKYSTDEPIQKFNNEQLKEILSSLLPVPVERSFFPSLPFILLPRTEKFIPIVLDDTIAIFSNTLLQKQIFQNKPLVFKDKNYIFIYPKDIPFKVEVNNLSLLKNDRWSYPFLISMQPGLSLTKFDEFAMKSVLDFPIDANMFRFFLFELFYLKSVSLKYFYFKKITIETKDSRKYDFYDVFVLPVEKDEHSEINLIFTDSDKKSIYFVQKITELLSVQKLTEFSEVLEEKENQFLNALYKYFYQIKNNPKIDGKSDKTLREIFDFDDLLLLLSEEEKKQLEQMTKEKKEEKEEKKGTD